MNQHIQVGPGLLGTLFIVFLLLKVFNVVSWSWWIVCAPLLVGIGLFVFIMIISLIIVIVAIKHG